MQIIKRNGQVAEFDPDKIYQVHKSSTDCVCS